jgi:hypothetical protein
MARYSLPAVILWFMAGPAFASSWADGLFDELSRDFGTVPRGTVLTHPFRLVNNTKNLVRISHVRVSCGCTSAHALQTTLKPGEETAILAQMDTRRFYSTKMVTVYVQFDQPNFEEVRLWVQANSRDDISVVPDSLTFGRIKRGVSPTSSVTVSFVGGGQYEITGATCDSNYIQTSYKLTRREGGDVVYELSAKIRADAPAGRWFTDVWLKTNNPSIPRIRVPLTVEIEAAVTASPGSIILGQIKAGTESERKLILRGVQPFRITGITGTDDVVTVRETNSESQTVHVLTVTLRPSIPGDLHRMIRIQTDLKTGGEIQFDAQAQVMP